MGEFAWTLNTTDVKTGWMGFKVAKNKTKIMKLKEKMREGRKIIKKSRTPYDNEIKE